ncbi:hypothetical protein [Alteribacter populi]|uniref:hypothetical protein n=1 Tax=Alteribacter populi TaxID=2011011 RepID=UPI000BBB3C46|nr:hypothetical protein [Alteribacter populi]
MVTFAIFAISWIAILFFTVRNIRRYRGANKDERKDLFRSTVTGVFSLPVFLFVIVGMLLQNVGVNEVLLDRYNQIGFIILLISVFVPAIFLVVYYLNRDKSKLNDPSKYKYRWMYKFRYVFLGIIGIGLVVSLVRLYQMANVVF